MCSRMLGNPQHGLAQFSARRRHHGQDSLAFCVADVSTSPDAPLISLSTASGLCLPDPSNESVSLDNAGQVIATRDTESAIWSAKTQYLDLLP